MSGSLRFARLALGIFGTGSLAAFAAWKYDNEKLTAQASWTTNFTPSVAWDHNWDRRDISSSVKPSKEGDLYIGGDTDDNRTKSVMKPKATRNLILIRHGQYNMSGKNDADRVLTEMGCQQAEITGQRLKELNFPWTILYHSTMKRATQTADIVRKHLPDVPTDTCDMCREGAPIPPEPPVGHWRPEAQQFFEDGVRIEAAFRKYFHRAEPEQKQDSYEIVVCHANVIRYWVCRALQFPPEAWLRISLNNCSLTWIAIRPSGRVTLRALGDSGHIPSDLLSSS